MNYLNRLPQPAPVNLFSAQFLGLYASLTAPPLAPLPAVGLPWIAVRQRFQQFHNDLSLTSRQFVDGLTKRNGVVNCLNRRYYGSESNTDNSFLVGSWGKDTAMRPPRDVDLYFVLPVAVHTRFQGHVWNRQSALLQEVKGVLTEKKLSHAETITVARHSGTERAIGVGSSDWLGDAVELELGILRNISEPLG